MSSYVNQWVRLNSWFPKWLWKELYQKQVLEEQCFNYYCVSPTQASVDALFVSSPYHFIAFRLGFQLPPLGSFWLEPA